MIRRLIILLLIVGCNETTMTVDEFGADNSSVHPLVGVWEMMEIDILNIGTFGFLINNTIIYSDDENNDIFIINEDGTCSNAGVRDSSDFSNNGTWSANENEITFIESNITINNDTLIMHYSINSDTLNLLWRNRDIDTIFPVLRTISLAIYKKQ